MLAISDGGSTKADWKILLGEDTAISVTITGFNPNYDTTDRIAEILYSELVPHLPAQFAGDIFYYGAGCWDPGRKKVVAKAFEKIFPKADINVLHDLLAAARAACGDEPGIACILGTGSNSVLYDGYDEVDNVTNLGFLLGDEGSGAVIGKELVKAYFYREMPTELHHVMEAICPQGRQDILDKVYGGGVPAAFLASFTKYFYEHRKHPFMWNLIKSCFDEFLVRHVMKYDGHQELPVHFIGSIAFHFGEILEASMREHNLKMGVVLQKPIDSLLQYHLEHLQQAPATGKDNSSTKTS